MIIRQDKYNLGKSIFAQITEDVKDLKLDLKLTNNDKNQNIKLGARISGKVLDAFNKPIKNAVIKLTASELEPLTYTSTDDNGNFLIGIVPNSEIYNIIVISKGKISIKSESFTIKNGEEKIFEFSLKEEVINNLGVISGTLKEENTNAAIFGGVIFLYNIKNNEKNLVAITYSDINGEFLFSEVSYGEYSIQVSALGYLSKEISIKIKESELLTQNIFLAIKKNEENCIISGVITDNNNLPILNADVILYKVNFIDNAVTPVAFSKTNTNGLYTFMNVPKGNYMVKSNKWSMVEDSNTIQYETTTITSTTIANNLKTITINVTDFGADPSGKNDSTQAINEAIESAKAYNNPVIINFPKGEYQIYKDRAPKRKYHTSNTNSMENPIKTIGVLIEEQKNLTLEGNGSLFNIHGNMMAMAVIKSEAITLQNFSWDFEVPTTSEMTVLNTGNENGKNYIDYYISSSFKYEIVDNNKNILWTSEKSPYSGEYYWTEKGHHNAYSVVIYDPEKSISRRYNLSDGPFNNINTIKKLDNNKVRIVYNGMVPAAQKPGRVNEMCSSIVRETAGAFIWISKNTMVKNVNVHYMHGFGWLTQMSDTVSFYNVNFMPREGNTTVIKSL